MKRIALVAGALANKPLNGGAAWTRLSWVQGLQRLGFDVVFVEQIESRLCCDFNGDSAPIERSLQLGYFRKVLKGFGLRGALVVDDGERIIGHDRTALLKTGGQSAFLLNISGNLRWAPLIEKIGLKAYLDLDPGYTQIWHAEGIGLGLNNHDLHFTIGENIPAGKADLPDDGIQWRTTRQPVVLGRWPACPPSDCRRFTTVASWRGGYGAIAWKGLRLGPKAHQFRRFIELPRQVEAAHFEVALDIAEEDRVDRIKLLRSGWNLAEPRKVAGEPWAFRDYVQRSGAECSVAQGVYVETATGWFSDRTVRYLASGRHWSKTPDSATTFPWEKDCWHSMTSRVPPRAPEAS